MFQAIGSLYGQHAQPTALTDLLTSLCSYDKADTVAAALALPATKGVLLLGPLDELMKPLSAAAAKETYAFARAVGGARLAVRPGAVQGEAAVLAAVVEWLGA